MSILKFFINTALLCNALLFTLSAFSGWTEATIATHDKNTYSNTIAVNLLPNGEISIAYPRIYSNDDTSSITIYQQYLNAPDWKVTENTMIVPDSDPNPYPRMDVDRLGATHLAYILQDVGTRETEDYTYQLWYHTNKSGAWKKELIMQMDADIVEKAPWDISIKKGTNLSLELVTADQHGNIHLVLIKSRYQYYGATGQQSYALLYVTNQRGQWQVSTIDDNFHSVDILYKTHGKRPQPASIAIDQDGYAHIGYIGDITNRDTLRKATLYYANNRDGDWNRKVIDNFYAENDPTTPPVITVDSQNAAHLLYAMTAKTKQEIVTRLQYADNTTGVWKKAVMDFSPSNQMAAYNLLTKEGTLYALYQKGLELVYATKTANQAWEKQVLKTATGFTQNTFTGGSGSGKDTLSDLNHYILLLDQQNSPHAFTTTRDNNAFPMATTHGYFE